TQLLADYPSYFTLQSWSIAGGTFFDQADERDGALVADIGQTVATNLYGDADPLGQTILIRNVPFKVKGVLATKGSNGFRDQDDLAVVPFSSGQVRLFHQTYVQDVFVQVASADQMTTVQTAVEDLLRSRHRLTGSARN